MQLKVNAAALAVMSVLVSAPAMAAEFSNAVFFGDSLTDSGYYKPLLPLPGVGKFTTNPGPVWSEILAASLGFQANPANMPGGTNYAQGGARVDSTPGVGGGPATGAQPISTQIGSYLAATGGRADPGALYTVWAGANDIFAAVSGSPAAAQGSVVNAASADVAQIARLRAAGARYIVVPSLPDMGRTPAGLASGPIGAAGMTQLSGGYNQVLYGGLAAAGISVIPADTFTLLREVTSSPASYGFSNASGVACTTSSSLLCSSATLVAPDAAQTYMFADGVHPSSAGHALMANYIGSIIAAPSQISLLAESPVQTRQTLVRGIGEQMRVSNQKRAANTTRAWASGNVGRLDYDESGRARDGDGTPWTGTVGIDRKYSDNFLAGLALAYGYYNGDFSGGRGDYAQREWSISAFGEYTRDAWRLNAIGTYGKLDYDVDRAVQLGAMKRKMSASTDGDNLSLALLGGYEFQSGSVTHGPWAGVQLQWIDVDGFSEGGSSSALRFGSQKRNSTVGSIGYRATMDAGNYTPFGSVSWNHEFRDEDREVTASLTSMAASSFAMPGVKAKRDWATLSGGVSVRVAPSATAVLSASAEVGRGDVTNYGVHAGINFQF